MGTTKREDFDDQATMNLLQGLLAEGKVHNPRLEHLAHIAVKVLGDIRRRSLVPENPKYLKNHGNYKYLLFLTINLT